ncbi:TonB-linked SusC/RagA family outer membrane protein [Larkinella arboricola]|uniref:TonB-linked SusC/RagA family outer membrane protein n=2 Tax=Larkinella arboricola TaxID=643671 RepID=A0A327X9G9_LARAB|nr:TonB-linked SusC/RagA family outer membrane protein [Larkinella arboricola]
MKINFLPGYPRAKQACFRVKLLVAMTRILFLLIATFTQVAADGLGQNITLNAKNAPLETVLTSIEKQTSFLFLYDKLDLPEAQKISVRVKNATIDQALTAVFQNLPLSYRIFNQTIVLKKVVRVSAPESLLPLKLPEIRQAINPIQKTVEEIPQRANRPIRGKVTDENGNAFPGVSILVKNSQMGTTTDNAGEYRLNIPDALAQSGDLTLVASFVGYKSQEIRVGNRQEINFGMVVDTKTLNDVVVVGYGTQAKSSITGSVASVPMKSISNQPLSSLDQAMAGQIAGVNVAQTKGAPGGGVSVRVRGTGSIGAGNEPLYVIDGFPVGSDYNSTLNPLATINPNDIESIEILKDASAAAIYGSRGSNGVVLVTTKHGKSGKSTVQFDTYYGLQQVANKIEMLNAREYAEYNTEARNNAWVDRGGKATDPNSVRPANLQIPEMFMNPESLGKGTDWQDEVFRTAPIQNHQLSVSGGTDKTQFFVSGAYFKQDGIVMNTGFDRYSARINLDHQASDRVKIGLNLSPSFSSNKLLPVEDQVFTGGILGSALSLPPTVPVYNPDGSFTTLLGPSPYNIGVIDNPVAIASKIQDRKTFFRTLGNAYAEIRILEGLKFRTSFGLDYADSRQNAYYPSDLGRDGVPAPVQARASASTGRDLNWLNENILSYKRTFNGKHELDVLAGFTAQKARSEYSSLAATNFPTDLVTTLNAGQVTAGGTGISEWSLLSYLGRVNYTYASKYLFSATVRRDGSSRFGASNKWGTFPSASVGWYVSEEDFFKNQPVVTDLKIRASYGLAGNNAIGNYSQIGLLGNRRYSLGAGTGTVVYGLYPLSITNDQLGWEMMQQMDIGLDFGVLRNRLMFTVDYYNKNTTDLLLNVPVPGSTGYETALQNIGKVNNRGWEFSVNSKNLTGGFKWSTNFNISFNRNKVVALGPEGNPIISKSPSFSPNTHITRIGSSIGSFWGYDVIGIYQTQEEVDNSPAVKGSTGSRPGDLKFRDVDGDGTITPNDVTIIGDNYPDFFYGITNNFSVGRFDLSILGDGVQGLQLLNGSRRNIGLVNGSYSRKDVLGRWQSPEKPGDGRTPRANVSPTGGNVSYVSSLLVEDASFFRIRNINLRYALPETACKALFIRNASVSLSVQNAFTFTKYRGYNPEQSLNGSSSLTPGVDFNGYPLARTYTLGLNVTF